jgi:hydroxyacylglutathione hydrolase
MQVSEHVHALRLPFQIPVGPGKTLDRFVYSYLLLGEKVTLVDAGVSSSPALVLDYLKKAGRRPQDIALLILTHSHPDHIGGAREIARVSGCRTAAPGAEAAWIEDTERQFRERPIPGFHSLVGGPVKIDLPLRGGECLDLGGGLFLDVVHTPGHSQGSMSLHFKQDGVLISGDAVPLRGGLPIYEDVSASVASLEILRRIEGLNVLLSSWDEPRSGESVYALMDDGIAWIRHIDEVIRKERGDAQPPDFTEFGERVMEALGFPPMVLGPMAGTIRAHLRLITPGSAPSDAGTPGCPAGRPALGPRE